MPPGRAEHRVQVDGDKGPVGGMTLDSQRFKTVPQRCEIVVCAARIRHGPRSQRRLSNAARALASFTRRRKRGRLRSVS
ncbi:hypothetical protein IAQ61_002563 [Plenodomus lingam]|uniref:uncharacterized protein n=1 Tax=Leptosphaeria maculans TaxID=5022 RepID=UPI00331EC167|nr:hypothetical protein IAQ61_002563 [Plenodomus lingam]